MCSDQEPQPSNPMRVVHSHHSQEQDHMEVPVLTGPASMISFEVALFRRVWAQRGASSFLRIWAK